MGASKVAYHISSLLQILLTIFLFLFIGATINDIAWYADNAFMGTEEVAYIGGITDIVIGLVIYSIIMAILKAVKSPYKKIKQTSSK
ncbi:hypothetical protein SAMN05216389_10334 [Oceanobacillus limi]|uniref:Uncharacterized protein n=1 Tax=Oceanobacillus limi TaxID=930131 RepID=A0A1I0A1V6_9BACI|nr:hypothetical protein [Oceanobacillus limi]SES88097.1 hypothetical protein SAMN05216389_10334 [Oceanobacillus limi]